MDDSLFRSIIYVVMIRDMKLLTPTLIIILIFSILVFVLLWVFVFGKKKKTTKTADDESFVDLLERQREHKDVDEHKNAYDKINVLYYINLDERLDRKDETLNELKKLFFGKNMKIIYLREHVLFL